jgi:hypothetical protein
MNNFTERRKDAKKRKGKLLYFLGEPLRLGVFA